MSVSNDSTSVYGASGSDTNIQVPVAAPRIM